MGPETLFTRFLNSTGCNKKIAPFLTNLASCRPFSSIFRKFDGLYVPTSIWHKTTSYRCILSKISKNGPRGGKLVREGNNFLCYTLYFECKWHAQSGRASKEIADILSYEL